MIKETDGDYFEEMRSLEQDLTFETAEKEISI
jgi:ATP-dependent DNA helicase RecG